MVQKTYHTTGKESVMMELLVLLLLLIMGCQCERETNYHSKPAIQAVEILKY